MNSITENELTVEQACQRLTAVRNELIGDEGESIAMVQMFDAELYGRVAGGELEKVVLTNGGTFLILEIPHGYKFHLQKMGELEDGFTPILERCE